MEIIEDGNWTNIQTIHRNEPIAHSATPDKYDKDAIMSYSTSKLNKFEFFPSHHIYLIK